MTTKRTEVNSLLFQCPMQNLKRLGLPIPLQSALMIYQGNKSV